MNEKHLPLIEAALKRFAHYGVKKTSMAEVADDAGVTRRTLYNAFANKEEVIFAALLHYAGQSKKDVERDCEGVEGASQRLDILYQHLVLTPYQAMQHFPHMGEVLEVGESLPPDQKAAIKAEYVGAIRLVLAPYEAHLKRHDLSLDDLCVFIKGAMTQIKGDAENEEQLSVLFNTLKAMTMGLVLES